MLWLVLMLCCSGCRSTEQPKVELSLWTVGLSPTYDSYIKSLITSFEVKHPALTISWLDMPQEATRQKLMAAIAAGSPPDLVNLDTEFALAMAQSGALTDLKPYINSSQQAEYFPNIWSACEVKGELYAVPWYVTTRVIMMNEELLKEAGISPNPPPSTWAELYALARQVRTRTKAAGIMPSIRIINDWSMAGVPIINHQTLAPEFITPEAESILDTYRQLYAEGVIPPETLTEGYKGALDRYKAGGLAFLDAGPQFLLRIKAEAPSVYAQTIVAPLPKTPTNTIPAATMNLVVPVSSKKRKLAIELALFITSAKAQLEFAKLVPLLPSSIESTKNAYFTHGPPDKLLAQALRISIEQLPKARDFSLALPRQKDLMRSLNLSVERAIRGEISSKAALNEASKAWTTILAPFSKRESQKHG